MKKKNNSEELTPSKMTKVLDWAYDKAVNGVPGLGTAEDLARDFMKGNKTLEKKIEALVRWQKTKAATTGFVTGLGGLITLPVAIPADIASTLYIQIRMVAAIALMKGYDLHDDRVKSLVYLCLVSDSVKDVLEQFGIKFGEKVLEKCIQKIPVAVLRKINQKVGFRLLTKYGEKGLINLTKAVPIVGGFVNAGLDILSTNKIAKVTRNTFDELILS